MVTARELVTKLSFQFDRSKLDTFERSIANFKNNIVITAGDIAKAFSGTLDFLTNIAKSRIGIKDIADFAGLATEEFVAMRLAAKQLGVQTNTFDSAIRNLTKNIKLARVGQGSFLELVKQSAGAVRLPFSNDNLENVENALEDIFKLITNITDKSEQLRVLGEILETDEAGTAQILRLINQGLPKFKEFIEANRDPAKQFAAQEEAAIKLQQQIDRLETSWMKLYTFLEGLLIPALSHSVDTINLVIDAITKLKNIVPTGTFGLFGAGLSTTNTEPGFVQKALNEFESFVNPAFNQPALAPVTANTTINVEVPPGTTEEQSRYIADEVSQAIQQVIDMNARAIISSNPMVE